MITKWGAATYHTSKWRRDEPLRRGKGHYNGVKSAIGLARASSHMTMRLRSWYVIASWSLVVVDMTCHGILDLFDANLIED